MLKAWKLYQNCLTAHPVKTQIISSGILWGIGDIAAQRITHSRRIKVEVEEPHLKTHDGDNEDEQFKVNWKRAAITSGFGFGFVGPIGHYWYEGLDRLIRSRLRFPPNSLRFVASKIALDGGVFGPIYGISFFSYIGFASGKNLPEVKEGIKRDLIPSMAVGAAFGPIIQFINFRYVPLMYQLLYVNMFCLLDSGFMSWLEQQEDAPWKKRFTSFLTFEEQQLEKKPIKEC
ncbi:hypothetical protein MKW98_008304 [Papaver atlanticum]|uniref:Uncharacterized protein n=1 Tax=Papaver atlanticum TaxID=357466 RepID=A0AAD4XAQ0_9MAGN|nr:hypothetical protein MKW98_008304 [Papaver atlanticum]